MIKLYAYLIKYINKMIGLGFASRMSDVRT